MKAFLVLALVSSALGASPRRSRQGTPPPSQSSGFGPGSIPFIGNNNNLPTDPTNIFQGFTQVQNNIPSNFNQFGGVVPGGLPGVPGGLPGGQGGGTNQPSPPVQSDDPGLPPVSQPVIPIISYEYSPPNAEGSYQYSYESGDGTKREEKGEQKAVGPENEKGTVVSGSYSYTDADGRPVQLSYTADERGFIPRSDILPTPHPIPQEIMQALEQNAAAEAAENGGTISPAFEYFFKHFRRRN